MAEDLLTQDITITDQFCGAGGSSIGAVAAGARLVLAMNHWDLAIETHNTNFPDAAHACCDISSTDPRRFPSTDILITSPECTNHSQAKSKKHVPDLFDQTADPEAERSRATMWDVPRFAERHDYETVVVENVVEARNWRPYEAWLHAMETLDYKHQAVYLNSMVAWPTPQSRDRMYVVFWKRKNRAPDLHFAPPCWCWHCERQVEGRQTFKRRDREFGKYRTQYHYRCPTCLEITSPLVYPAASAIDWSLPAPRIGDRKRPLAAATRRRVALGLERFGRPPFYVKNYGNAGEAKYRAHPIDHPLGAVTAEDSHAVIVQAAGHTFERPGYARAWPVDGPIPTQTATLQHALVLDVAYGGDEGHVRPDWLPMATQTGRQTHAVAIPPEGSFMVELRGGSSDVRGVDEPSATVTASGNHLAVAIPPFVMVNRTNNRPRGVGEPFAPMLTADHHAVVQPPSFIVKNYGTGFDPSMVKDPNAEPLGAVTGIDHHSLVTMEPRPPVEVDDCGFRMLEPPEIGRAMAFPTEYTVLGSKRDRVRQYGNAVTPPVMALLLGRVLDSLAPTGAE